jgi:membrane protein DedA with SNARE-associated domain
VRLLGPEGLMDGERLFARVGGWLVVLSRWLPVFPEVIACMAGLARMPPLPFFAALVCGSAPLGFGFAAIGHAGGDYPVLAIALSAGLPPLLWLAVRPYFRAKRWAHLDDSTHERSGRRT